MVLIEGFARTKDTYDKFGDLVPGKLVKVLNSFYMDVTEVTVGQFKVFLKSSGYEPKEPINWEKLYKYSPTDEHPMIYVTWFDATAYCEWAGKGLPTEKEWEFAARGGLIDKEFPWGDDKSVAEDYAHFDLLSRQFLGEALMTAPVGSLKPNGYGLHDVAGNVWEWCEDWYSADKTNRVLRGGSFYDGTYILRVAHRLDYSPSDIPLEDFGFRCVSDMLAISASEVIR